MKLVRYLRDGDLRVGIDTGSGIAPTRFSSVLELIASGGAPEPAGDPVEPDRTLAPIARPGKILGSGVNFQGHLDENPNGVLPQEPEFFSKLPSSVVGPGDPIVIPVPERQVDYEVELAIVIGRVARDVPRERALEHVFGYTIVHDVSARDLQFRNMGLTLGKGLDTFCPMGPAIVTVDEFGDASGLELASYLNGQRVQQGNTSQWLFGVERIVEFLSSQLTLEPGDLVTTGTPAGVGFFRRPQLFLSPGDQVTVEVEGVGRLTNPVVGAWQ